MEDRRAKDRYTRYKFSVRVYSIDRLNILRKTVALLTDETGRDWLSEYM